MTEKNLNIAMFGHKHILSREGGIEVVVKELATRMVKCGNHVICYDRSTHHVSGAEVDSKKEYKGVKIVPVWTIEKKGLAALTSSFSAALKASRSKADVVHIHAEGPAAMCWIPKLRGKRVVVTIHGACEIMRTTGEKPENKRLHGTVVFYPKSKLHDIPSWDEQIEYAPVNTSGRLCRTGSGAVQPPFRAGAHWYKVKSFNSHIKENSLCDARPHRPSPVGRKKMPMALSFHSRVENRTEIQNHQIDYSTQIPECKPEINRKGKAPLPYSAILPAAG